MNVQVSCPVCGTLVDAQARQCPQCGVELALAAAIAERAVKSAMAVEPTMPITPEILVPRIGDYLRERGVLSQEDLQHALDYNRALAAKGESRLVGQVLLELGLVDRETLDQVITEQILRLQDALQQANRQLEQRVRERTSELQSALNRLSELNQLKSNFISNVSHELRTPLTHIKGYLDLLSDGSLGTLSKEQVNAMQVMLRAEARLEELIEELIQFSMAASDIFTLQKTKIDFTALIKSSVTKSSDRARARSVVILVNSTMPLAIVYVDDEKISWVVMELIENAIKFTPPGGTVTVELIQEGEGVRFSVTDTGIGIPYHRMEELFEPFHQLDGSATRRYGGVGLGLALAQKIVEAHGSTFGVSSEEGKGSCFSFYLPLMRSE